MNKLNFNKNASKGSKRAVQFNPADYVQYLDGMDVTDEQAEKMLMTLWDMMIQFVDLGFTINDRAERKSHSTVKLDSEHAKKHGELDKKGNAQ